MQWFIGWLGQLILILLISLGGFVWGSPGFAASLSTFTVTEPHISQEMRMPPRPVMR